jgi:hypothetical protein
MRKIKKMDFATSKHWNDSEGCENDMAFDTTALEAQIDQMIYSYTA